ncbi:hypothetical protein [Novosphingobium sp. MBES04]|uniref:hypothetical protein n=1 Tax=Novosphingobium sp. MBES04 TaxID=1206458 RepID=UPI00057E438E|nr:hypothetical protein [Novosphingobium sp. MBES04]GAM03133.1 hypothetical conserved protein [Novosphingobium sp. MBES04]
MSLLAITLTAAAAMAPVHTVEHEQNGKAYTVSYVAHVESSARQIGIAPAGRRGMKRCEVSGLVTIERRITDAASGKAISAMLPGTREVSHTRAGRCVARDTMHADLVAKSSADLDEQLALTAQEDRPHVAATIAAARSLAAR